jgi:rubrerythrin
MALVDIGIRIAQFTVISADAERGWMAMTRLIDADAIDAIRASASKYTGFMEMEMYTDDDAVEAINGVPSAEPVRHGKWIKADSQQYFRKHYPCFTCSECGYRKDSQKKWDYCPNCGARMDKE